MKASSIFRSRWPPSSCHLALWHVLCSGTACTPSTPVLDIDADGWSSDLDCDDGDAGRHPMAQELCDGIDQDCDAILGAGEALDEDQDGVLACGDCDDANPLRAPGIPEFCDGLDGDCDGLLPVEEQDVDGDAFMICEGDCNDVDAGDHPGVPPECAGDDLDCDGFVTTPIVDDESPPCWGDCDDEDPETHPRAIDLPDGIDQDCLLPFDLPRAEGYETALIWPRADLDASYKQPHGIFPLADVDGDGLDDWAIGPEKVTIGDGFESQLRLLTGQRITVGGVVSAEECPELLSWQNSYFDFPVPIGDIDGDGKTDAAMSYREVPPQEEVFVGVRILTHAVLSGSVIDGFANSPVVVQAPSHLSPNPRVAAAGDVDGNGFDDLFVGMPEVDLNGADSGVVCLLLAPFEDGEVLDCETAPHRVVGRPESELGSVLLGPGDVDGDLVPDLFVIARGAADGATRTLVFSGTTLLNDSPLFEADVMTTILGTGVFQRALGDIDGDALADVTLGVGGHPTHQFVILRGADLPPAGVIDVAELPLSIEGISPRAKFHRLNDRDGDDVPDFLVADPLGLTLGGNIRGHVFTLSGAELVPGLDLTNRGGGVAGEERRCYGPWWDFSCHEDDFGHAVALLGGGGESSLPILASGRRGISALPDVPNAVPGP